MTTTREISYLNRDYSSLKNELVNFVKTYFPDTFDDFSENSPGMALIEIAAYVGDVLSFYQDRNFQECFIENVTEYKNAISIAKNLGFKPRGTKPSYGKVNVTAIFSSTSERTSYGFVLKKGTQFYAVSDTPITFETIYDIDFSTDDANTFSVLSAGNIYVTKQNVNIVSGKTKTFDALIGAPQKFYQITLPDKDVFNIVKVLDANNNQYYEVNSLSQDTIMASIMNYNSSSADVPYNLALKYVPRRFVVSLNGEGYPVLTFGSGIDNIYEYDFIPNPDDYTINPTLIGKYETPIDNISIENFLTTNSLGFAPNNTTLNITYTKGGGLNNNVGPNTINKISKTNYEAKDSSVQNSALLNKIVNNLIVTNPQETSGGSDADNVYDIRYIAPKYFATQARAVTLQDFIALAKSMPSQYGSIYRCNAKVNSNKNNTIDIYVLSKFLNGSTVNFQKPQTLLKQNLLNYLTTYRCMNDIITINDAQIIDIGVEFAVRIDSRYINSQEVLANCLLALKDYFDIKNWDIEQPIYIGKVSNIITNTLGVLAVYNLQIVKKENGYEGRTYSSDLRYDLQNKGGKIICPPNSAFQIRYPSFDLNGAFIVD